MLEFRNTFTVTEAKHFPIYRIVSDAKLTAVVSVSDVQDFDAVGQNRDAMSLQQSQHHHIIGFPLNTDDGIERAIKFGYFISDTAAK